MATIEVDARAVDKLAADIGKAKRQILGRLAERGYQLLRGEIKDTAYETGNLWQGVAPPDVDYEKSEAVITVSARSASIGGREAKVIGKDGKEKRSVTLRPQQAFNYAPAVARGRAAISPKSGKALIIPVPTAPSGESYLIADGKIYIVRRSAKATKPNPFDERAAKKLEGEAVSIGEAVLKKYLNDGQTG
jgi:hypothetical protein